MFGEIGWDVVDSKVGSRSKFGNLPWLLSPPSSSSAAAVDKMPSPALLPHNPHGPQARFKNNHPPKKTRPNSFRENMNPQLMRRHQGQQKKSIDIVRNS